MSNIQAKKKRKPSLNICEETKKFIAKSPFISKEQKDLPAPCPHLHELQISNELSHKIFKLLPFNLHYEILQFLHIKDLYLAKCINLGGYQIIANPKLRGRIKYKRPYIRADIFKDLMYDIGKLDDQRKGKLIMVLGEVRNLDFFDMNLGFQIAKSLSANLKYITMLLSINLEHNHIGDEGITLLSQEFRYISNLEVLNLNMNRIQEEGAEALSKYLQFIPSLRELFLWNNQLGAKGCCYICTQFTHIPKLTSLDLTGNKIKDEGAFALANNLQYVPKLTELKLCT